MHGTHNVSVSKHLRGEKKDGWICPLTRKFNFTRPLIRIKYTSTRQSRQAALKVPKSILTTKMFKKKLNYLIIFFYFNQGSLTPLL